LKTDKVKSCQLTNKCTDFSFEVKDKNCFCVNYLINRTGYYTNSPKKFAKENHFADRKLNWKNFLAVPVLVNNKLIGQIALADKAGDFNDEDLDLVQQIAVKFAMVILRLTTENQLIENRNLYHSLFQHMKNGFALHEIIVDEEQNPIDYKFIDVNDSFEKITGLKKELLIGKTVLEVIPGIEKKWIEIYGKVALNGEAIVFEMESPILKKKFKVNAFSPKKDQFATLFEEG